jgi:hypothetical protein
MNRTTRTGLLAAVLAVVTPAQDTLTPAAALARAQLLEQQEGDLAQAEQAYRALLAAPNAAAVHGAVALRLGALLWRLERRDEAQPLLEQAAAAGGNIAAQAQALLQGQGPDAQQEAERRERAQLLLNRLGDLSRQRRDDKGNLSDADQSAVVRVGRELDALGASAAAVLADELQRDVPLQWGDGSPEYVVRAHSTAAWRIGHPPAQQALLRIADTGSVERRVFHAECATRTDIAADMEPVLLRFASAPDPTGEVWPHAAEAFRQLPLARLDSLLEDESAGIRGAALAALAGRWQNLTDSERESLIAERGATIRTATRDTDRRVNDSAWQVIAACLRRGPTSGTYFFFDEIDRARQGVFAGQRVSWNVVQDDAWIQAAAAAAQRLGPVVFDIGRSGRSHDTLLALLNSTMDQRWRQGGVDAVITLLELGYGSNQFQDGWAAPAVSYANPDQIGRLLRAGKLNNSSTVNAKLVGVPLPPAAFATLRTLVDEALRSGNRATPAEGRTVRGRQQSVVPAIAPHWLNWAAGMKHADVAIWLGELAAAQPTLAHHCAEHLVSLAQSKVKAALPPLRALLVWEGNEENELHPTERNRVFGALAAAGDIEAIPLFPRAYELGLDAAGNAPVGIDFLCEGHGYEEAPLRQSWQALLDSGAAASVFRDLNLAKPLVSVPLPVLDRIVERLATQGNASTGRGIESKLPERVRSRFSELSAPLPETSPLLAATRKFLGTAEPTLAVQLFHRLHPAVARQLGSEGLALLRRAGDGHMVHELSSKGIELTIEDWRMALKSEWMRGEALKALPLTAPLLESVRSQVEALLIDPEEGIRQLACETMPRLFGSDAVPALLPLLQDRDEGVRTTARAALDQLRQDAEQRAFWREARTGIDLRPQAAASKLLLQAKAGEPKEQRLLALRSLAILGAAEALPYLIDLTKDQDQELAAAARAAITSIHQRGDTPGAAK